MAPPTGRARACPRCRLEALELESDPVDLAHGPILVLLLEPQEVDDRVERMVGLVEVVSPALQLACQILGRLVVEDDAPHGLIGSRYFIELDQRVEQVALRHVELFGPCAETLAFVLAHAEEHSDVSHRFSPLHHATACCGRAVLVSLLGERGIPRIGGGVSPGTSDTASRCPAPSHYRNR